MAARFDAFISYSRAASSTLAVDLRNGIERFAKPWYRLRSSRVFLDDASMSANTGLWSTIERGLTEAEWFILLCSPKSAASQYVTTEIAWWLEHKSADRILLVLDEGEMTWDAAAGDFDWSRASAVNPALSKAFAEEPRWVDLSWFEQEGSLRSADPRFPERVADLASAVRGVERDELVGENVQQRRRALRLARGAIVALSGLLVASLVATGIAVVNGNAAAEQARIAQARQLAAQAIVASTTDLQLASLLAVEAVRLHADSQTEAALFQLQNTSPYLVRSLRVGAYVRATALADDGTVVIGDDDGVVSSWQGSTRTDLIQLPGRVQGVAVSADHSVVAGVTSDPAAVAVLADGRLLQPDLAQTVLAESGPVRVAVSPDGRYIAVGGAYEGTLLFENTGRDLLPIGGTDLGGRAAFGDDSLTVFNSAAAHWQRLSLADGSVLVEGDVLLARTSSAAISGDGRRIAGSTEQGLDYDTWSTASATTVDTPADRIATSTISGTLDFALDSDGSRLATQIDGAIYVSTVRDRSEVPQAPLVLDGSGAVNVESMSFVGDTLVTGSGDGALVWDLTGIGRGTTRFDAPIPEGCLACGIQVPHLNQSATRLAVTDQSGFSTIVADLETGAVTTVAGFDAPISYYAGTWFDDRRLIAYSPGDSALLILSGSDYATVDFAIPIAFDEGASPLSIRTDGTRVVVLDDAGGTQTLDVRSGDVLASTRAFAPGFDGPAPAGFDIAADLNTAYMWWYGGLALYANVDDGTVVYQAQTVDGMSFDGSSRLHVFAKGSEWTVDRVSGALGPARPAEVDSIPPPVVDAAGDLVVQGDTTGFVTILDLAARGSVLGRIAVPNQDGKHVVSLFTPDRSKLVMTLQAMDLSNSPASVRIVDLTVDGWIRASCAVAGRDLTAAEWGIYLGTTPPADLRCDR